MPRALFDYLRFKAIQNTFKPGIQLNWMDKNWVNKYEINASLLYFEKKNIFVVSQVQKHIEMVALWAS